MSMGTTSWIAIIELGALGEGVAVDKGPLRPLRPNAILGALEESIARRNREGRMWPAFLDFFGLGAWSTIRGEAAHQR